MVIISKLSIFLIIGMLIIALFALGNVIKFLKNIEQYLRENNLTDSFQDFVIRKQLRKELNTYERLRIELGKNK